MPDDGFFAIQPTLRPRNTFVSKVNLNVGMASYAWVAIVPAQCVMNSGLYDQYFEWRQLPRRVAPRFGVERTNKLPIREQIKMKQQEPYSEATTSQSSCFYSNTHFVWPRTFEYERSSQTGNLSSSRSRDPICGFAWTTSHFNVSRLKYHPIDQDSILTPKSLRHFLLVAPPISCSC